METVHAGVVMKPRLMRIGGVVVVAAGLAVPATFAQQTSVKRDFEAEIRAAVQSAKDASEFEFLGTLVRACLLPQSGGENTTDVAPAYVANPAAAPASETWYAEPAKVFGNLHFAGSAYQVSDAGADRKST